MISVKCKLYYTKKSNPAFGKGEYLFTINNNNEIRLFMSVG